MDLTLLRQLSIEQVKAKIKKCGEELNSKHKVKKVRNTRTNLGYTKDPRHG